MLHRKDEMTPTRRQDAEVEFDVSCLEKARLQAGMTLKQVAFKIGIGAVQVRRIESGASQLTLEFLDRYCRAIGRHVLDVIDGEVRVPVIGLVGDDSVIRPIGAADPVTVRAPRLVGNPDELRAVRFAGYWRMRLMKGHVAFFSAAHEGVPDTVWETRSIIRLTNGQMRLGWPFKRQGQVHISEYNKDVDFDIEIEWAAPLIAVICPELIE